MDAVHPSVPSHPVGGRGWRVSRRILYVVVTLVVLVIGVRLALPSVLRRAINSRLEKIPDYTGWVDHVGVSLTRGAYTLHGLVIQKQNGGVKEPYFRADRIDFSIAWRELLHGKLVSDIALEKPMLTLVEGESAETSQVAADSRWQDAVNDIFPIDITWLKITDGQIRYINNALTPKVDIRVAHLRALATGLRNRAEDSAEEFPARLSLEGETIGSGVLKVVAQAEPLAVEPHFLLKLELERVSLPAMNEFLRAYGGVDVSQGTFSGYVEVVARDGHYQGYFKPFFDQVDFQEQPGESTPIRQQVWEWFVRSFAWIFKNHARDEVATKIPFQGEVKDLQFGTWETIRNLLHHAFIAPLQKKLDSKAPGGTGAVDPDVKLPKANKPEKGADPKAEERKAAEPAQPIIPAPGVGG